MEELVEERPGNEDGEDKEYRQIGNTKPEFTDAIYGRHVFKRHRRPKSYEVQREFEGDT
jgi:hypothetical protein